MVPLRARPRRAARGAVVAAAIALAVPRLQAQAGALLPLDDPAYQWIDALQARGALRALPALERPLRVAAIDSALAGEPARSATAALVDAVRRSLRRYLGGSVGGAGGDGAARAWGEVALGATGQTTARRELMLAEDSAGVHPGGWVRGGMTAGPLTAVTRMVVGGALREAPEFAGRKDRVTTARIDEGYLVATWQRAQFFVGRTARNLGPSALVGLQLGQAVPSFDHLFARVGGERLHLDWIVTRLDAYRYASSRDETANAARHLPAPWRYDYELRPDSLAQRWFALHRLAATLGRFDVALTESVVWGGVDRGFEPALANPLGLWTLSQYSERQVSNPSLGVDVAWRPARGGLLAAQLLVDDVQVDDCTPGCEEPPSYGVSVVADGFPLGGPARAQLSYTRVSHLAYRALNPWERYASFDVGLGRGESDYDEVRLGATIPTRRALARPYAAYRRQGAGDFRLPYPPDTLYAATPAFLGGPVWRTARVGVAGAASLGDLVEVDGDVGYNVARGVAHQPDARRHGFVGRVRVALRASGATRVRD